MKPYKVVGGTHIELTDTPYAGIVFKFGGVSFEEKEDECLLHFDYEVVEGDAPNDQIFKTYLGDILIELIEEGLARNDIVYTGGTD